MKIKSSPQVVDSRNITSPDILKHIQSITDDVRGILSGGLSFIDKQLPFEIRQVTVTNNQPVQLLIQSPYTIIGAIPIQTNGATINNITSQNNGRFSITLNMNVNTAQIVFLIIGVSA